VYAVSEARMKKQLIIKFLTIQDERSLKKIVSKFRLNFEDSKLDLNH